MFGKGLFVQDAGGFYTLCVNGPGFVGLGLFRFNAAGNGGNLLFALLNRGAYRLGLFNQFGVGFLAFHQFGNVHGFGVFCKVVRVQLFGYRVNESGKRLDVAVYAGAFGFQFGNRGVYFINTGADLFGQQGLNHCNLFAAAIGGFGPTGKFHGVEILIAEYALQHRNVVCRHSGCLLLDGKRSAWVRFRERQLYVVFFAVIAHNHFGKTLGCAVAQHVVALSGQQCADCF